jgi:predicted solute-binding protein
VPEHDSTRIGCVKYLNARPLIHGWRGELTLDTPAALCGKLAAGVLDVALVSSFEFLRHPVYRIVDGLSISSFGPVHSVVVASQGSIAALDTIELDPASETSVNLLRCLLAEQGLRPRLVPASSSSAPATGRLLIGDQALRFRQRYPDFRFWDLGEEWKERFALPFVFALWLIRPEVPAPESIATRLRVQLAVNLARIDEVIALEREFPPDFCKAYYRDNLRFQFGQPEQEGLRLFARLCAKHGLRPSPELKLNLV